MSKISDAERAQFEAWYVENAFDYEKNPIGSRDCSLQWTAWQAALVVCQPTGRVYRIDGFQRAFYELADMMCMGAETISPKEVWETKMRPALQVAIAARDPVRMVLYCPRCHMQHVDAPDDRTPGWQNPPHRSHLCHGCGLVWRPADVPTVGVERTQTTGKNDTPFTPPAQQVQQEPVCSGGFVISNGSGDKYRAWGQSGPEWVSDVSAALWLVRRADAEALSAKDEDAWAILPVKRCALPHMQAETGNPVSLQPSPAGQGDALDHVLREMEAGAVQMLPDPAPEVIRGWAVRIRAAQVSPVDRGQGLISLLQELRAASARNEMNGLEADSIGLTEAARRCDVRSETLAMVANKLEAALAASQPGAEEPVSPMAKMAAALREKAAIEHTEYSQRVQSGEWGPMPEAGTQADFCRYCEGSGWGGESRKTKCPACSGTGMPVPPAQAVDLATLKAVSDEYNEWILFHAAGNGDYDDFLRGRAMIDSSKAVQS